MPDPDTESKTTPSTADKSASPTKTTEPSESPAEETAPPVESLAIEVVEIASIPLKPQGSRGLKFSNDGSTLMLTSLGPIQRWSVPTLSDHRTYKVNSQAADFSPDDKLLAVTVSDKPGVAQILNADNGDVIKEFNVSKPDLTRVRFSPDGRTVAFVGRTNDFKQKSIDFWDVASGQQKNSVKIEGNGWAQNIAFSPDSKFFAFADQGGGEIRIWDVEAGKEDWRYKVPAAPRGSYTDGALQWCPDGKVAVVTLDGSYHLMNMGKKKVERTFFPEQEARIWTAALSPDGRLFAKTDLGNNGQIEVVDAWAGKTLQVLTGHSMQVEWVAFSSDRKFIASINADGKIELKLWELRPTTAGK
jgi:WD40 repeat protein